MFVYNLHRYTTKQYLKNMSAKRVYFKNLNGVRFLAALLVIIHHMEMGKFWFDQPNVYRNSFVGGIFGQLGIILFFVLSGFLITYLLLEEHKRSGTISIKSFYMRRVLRIWPVYYLIVLFSLFVAPQIDFLYIPDYTEHINDGFLVKAGLYLSFLPNLGYVVYEHIAYATQTWSVGVEEQFYLIWPVLMLWAINKKKMLPALLGFIGVYLSLKTVTILVHEADLTNKANEGLWLFVDHFSIDCMAIGGIGAYLLFHKKDKILKVLFNKYLQLTLYILLAIITVKGWVLPLYHKELLALLFVIVILNLAGNKNSIINLEFRLLNYLGKISYGLYMYHNLVLIVVLKLLMMYNLADLGTVYGNVIYYLLSLGLTVILSAVSYEYFEKWFLKLKDRFAKVKSGEAEEESNTLPEKHEKSVPLSIPGNPQVA